MFKYGGFLSMSTKKIYHVISILIILFLFIKGTITQIESYTNLVTNPGFENGNEGWHDRTCGMEIDSTTSHSGKYSAKATQRLTTWQGIKQTLFDKMIDGETYEVSAWVKLDNAPSDSIALSFEQLDDRGVQYIAVAKGVVTNKEWFQLSGTFTLDIEGSLSVLDIYFEKPMPGVNFYVDDVIVSGPKAKVPEIHYKREGTGIIDIDERYQKIEGFGGSIAYYTFDFVHHAKKDELCKLLFKELDIDILRIRNNYQIEPQSFLESVEIVKCGKAYLEKDLKILITSWTPPLYLKSNGGTSGGTLKRENGKYMYDEFAQWWYNSIVAYSNAGVKADYISLQNELNYPAPWQSCLFNPTETPGSDIAGFDIAFEVVWNKLNAEMGAGMPKMIAPESSGMINCMPYIPELDNLSHVYGYAHHFYDCSFCGSYPDRFIPRMIELKNLVSKYGNKPIFQTEYEDGAGTWDDAMNTVLTMHNSLTIENVACYLYWDLFWDKESGLIGMTADKSSYDIRPTYYAFKNFSAFIHAGWQRVDASIENKAVRISAFISPDNKKLAAVIINTTENTNISLELSIKNFLVSKGVIYRTSETENCIKVGEYNGNIPLEIPANSITTLVLEK